MQLKKSCINNVLYEKFGRLMLMKLTPCYATVLCRIFTQLPAIILKTKASGGFIPHPQLLLFFIDTFTYFFIQKSILKFSFNTEQIVNLLLRLIN